MEENIQCLNKSEHIHPLYAALASDPRMQKIYFSNLIRLFQNQISLCQYASVPEREVACNHDADANLRSKVDDFNQSKGVRMLPWNPFFWSNTKDNFSQRLTNSSYTML